VKAPLLPVCVSLIKPVSRFWIVTLASATLAPDGSDTVPFSVAVVYWAKTAEDAIEAESLFQFGSGFFKAPFLNELGRRVVKRSGQDCVLHLFVQLACRVQLGSRLIRFTRFSQYAP